MANTTIKISQLPNLGNNLTTGTLIPVVSTNGTFTTDKVSVGNIANFILTEAGNILPEAFVSTIAYSVANAAQPNITSVGTLSINTLHISGGQNGYVLQTNGNGNLTWTASGGGGNGTPGGSNTQIQFNNDGLFGGATNFTFDATSNTMTVANIAVANIDVSEYITFSGGTTLHDNGTAPNEYFTIDAAIDHSIKLTTSSTIGSSTRNWEFTRDGELVFPGNSKIAHSGIDLQNVDLTAGPNGWAELESNDRNNYMWVDNFGAHIETHTLTSPTTWTFGLDGHLVMPGNVDYNGDSEFSIGSNISNMSIYGSGHTTVYSQDKIWDFDNTGNMIFPDGTIQTTAYTGGAGTELVNGDNSFVLDADGNVVFEGTPSGNAVNRGLVWDYGANANGVNSTIRQDNAGLTVRAWTEDSGNYAASVNIVTNQDANEKTWTFDGNGNLTVPSGSINSINDGGALGAYITLTPDLGLAKLAARNAENNVNYTSTSWISATYTGTQIDFVDAPDLVSFFTNNQFNDGVNQTFSINGDEPVLFTGYTIGVSNAVTVYTNVTPDPDPTTVTSIDFYYQLESYIAVDYDGGELNIAATGLTILIDNDQTEGPDIVLRSGDDITLQGKDMSLGSEREGGDINLNAGDGADDDGAGNTASTGGDIILDAGNGGDGNSSSGSSGGFTIIRGGAGGAAGVTNTAGAGGYVSIQGGDGGNDGGNTALGAGGGNVSITAGLTTLEGVNGPNVTITSGQGGPNALAGSVVISTPASVDGPGGNWTFDGDGNLTLPANTFAVNYANGTAVTFGAAALGNVTFDDVTVQGDNNSLNLSAGSDFTANLAYLQVRAGDVASHIHLDTGNNEAYDLIVGDDQNYVQVSSTGNILLSSYDSNTAQYIWTLDYNGNLILAGGNSVIQSIANSSLDILNPNVSTMVLTPDPGYSSQALVLDPTSVGHIHLRSPGSSIDQPSANLFLGGEASSFEVGQYNGAVPNLFIHSNNNTWTFDIDGNLTLPQLTTISDESGVGTTLTVGAPPTVIVIVGADFSPVNLTYIKDGANSIWYPAGYIPGSDPYIEFTGGQYGIFVPEFGQALYVNTGTLNIPLTQWNTNPPLGSVAPTAGYTYGASGPDWVFGADGKLTFPGTPRIDTATNNFEVQAAEAINFEANTVVNIYTDTGNNAFQWQFGDDGVLTLPGNLVAVTASPAPRISGFSSVSALVLTTPVVLYANLPLATIAGQRAFISDANLVAVGNFGNVVGNGGSNTVCVWSDGTDWRIG